MLSCWFIDLLCKYFYPQGKWVIPNLLKKIIISLAVWKNWTIFDTFYMGPFWYGKKENFKIFKKITFVSDMGEKFLFVCVFSNKKKSNTKTKIKISRDQEVSNSISFHISYFGRKYITCTHWKEMYLCSQCVLLITLRVRIRLMVRRLNTAVCDKVC